MWLAYLTILESRDTCNINFGLFHEEAKARDYISKEPFLDQEVDLDDFEYCSHFWGVTFIPVLK